MGELIMLIGGMSVLFGAFDLWDFGEDDDSKSLKSLKKTLVKIVGGLVIVGVGALMRHFSL